MGEMGWGGFSESRLVVGYLAMTAGARWWLLAGIWLVGGGQAMGETWGQFRGPNGSAVAANEESLPDGLSLEDHLIWKVAAPRGHSSPVIAANQVFLTGQEGDRLLTFSLAAATGKKLWEAEAPHDKLESVHNVGSRATPSVATDGELVVSFFGSSGLYCYDMEGKELWRRRMGPFNNQFGAASSPILAGDRVVLIEDHDTGSFLATYDKRTGEELWRVERPNFRRNYCSPVLWETKQGTQIVIAGTAHVVGYDLEDGDQRWLIRGAARVVNSTPVVGTDGMLYVATTGGGETPPQPSFDDLIAQGDKNANGTLEADELPGSPIKGFFGQFDRDADGSLDRTEYESIREIFSLSRSVAMAIAPGGEGDISDSHVRWSYGKSIPRNASPVMHQGHLFLVNDGGILATLRGGDGGLVKQGRLRGTGKFFSSPIVVDGKLLVGSDRGLLNIVTAVGEWEQLGVIDFAEDIYATPAVSEGRLYLRTTKHLYCLGNR